MPKRNLDILNLTNNYFDSHLRLKDGVKLVSRIWLPEGKGPWPTLLMRQPYGREIASTLTYAHPNWWTSNGYLVIIQDVRGQGGSDGTFEGFYQEAEDTSETHDWVRSLDLCNGKLGLYGFSYQGLTQLTGKESSIPPDCLSPAMTGLDIKEHWASSGNAFWWNNNILWALQITALKMKRELNENAWNDIRVIIENKTYLSEGMSVIKKYDPNNFILKWNDILDNQEAFKEIECVSSWLKKPMLIIGGLWDPHLKGAIDLYKKSLELGGKPEIVIGNATHLEWWKGSQKTLLNFFDIHLKDNQRIKALETNHKKVWNISLERWDEIKKGTKTNDYLGLKGDELSNIEIEDGSLLINSAGSGFTTLVHDPWRPAPMNGGHLGPKPGIFDRRNFDKRLDIAVFQTTALENEMTISGIPILETSIISDCESYDVCVALSAVNQNDESVKQFSTGFLRVKTSQRDKENTHYIELQPTNITIKKRDKLRISLSLAAWPAVGINPGDNNHNSGAPTKNHKVITIKFNLNNTFMKILPFF